MCHQNSFVTLSREAIQVISFLPCKKISGGSEAIFKCNRERSIMECLIEWNNNACAGVNDTS